ncbi:MAG: ribonuclease III domain-containing protein [Acidaminococcaceae bacterium]
MKFAQYQLIKKHALAVCGGENLPVTAPGQINAIVLAYIGDVVFSLYIRTRLLPVSSHVRVLHDLGAQMVSAVMQAKAMDALAELLDEEETAVVRRGRNTKSTVPKSATVREYRQGTAFEALIGWLFLAEKEARLEEILERSFQIIHAAMANKK